MEKKSSLPLIIHLEQDQEEGAYREAQNWKVDQSLYMVFSNKIETTRKIVKNDFF